MAEFILEKKNLIPTVRWFQTKENIILNFEVYDCTEENINIKDNSIYFYALSKGFNYKIEFEFFENIDSNDSKYFINDKTVKVILKKTNNTKWNYLTKDNASFKNYIKIDWNEWIDDEDDEIENPEFDFEKIMAGMKGMGGNMFNNMGGENLEEDENLEENENSEEDENVETSEDV